MALSTINRFISVLDSAFQGLRVQVSMVETERMAMIVYYAMESKTRAYHTSDHVFGMCEGMKPLQVLAALFHDIVYYQLDAGFPLHCADLLQGVARAEAGTLALELIQPDDTALSLCAAIFGLVPGQVMPLYGGLNEFLSAVVAARLLHTHLRAADLVVVIACMEATIAFRKPDGQGRMAVERLAGRVHQQYRRLFPDLGEDGVAARVTSDLWDVVALANRDVSSFAEADPGFFLSSTWLLIDESHAPLAAAGIYSVQEYRLGLTRMEGFLRGLDPMAIFQCYQGYPAPAEIARLGVAAQRNIAFACDFLGAKIASIAIVEALALCTGTDGPISMFLGDIRSTSGRPQRVEDFLPPVAPAEVLNPELLRVLEQGRTLESVHDLTASPITAFVYRCIGHVGIVHVLEQAHKMFDASLSPRAFLQSLDRPMVRTITLACSHIALSRSAALQELAAVGMHHTSPAPT